MKVKIGEKIYDSNEEPILVILSESDKENIKNMSPDATKYCSFPDTYNLNEIKEFINIMSGGGIDTHNHVNGQIGIAGSSPVMETKIQKLNKVMVDLDNAKFIGEGEWVKDSAYQVYELDGKYYSVIVVDSMNKEMIEDSITEIKFEDIEKYI